MIYNIYFIISALRNSSPYVSRISRVNSGPFERNTSPTQENGSPIHRDVRPILSNASAINTSANTNLSTSGKKRTKKNKESSTYSYLKFSNNWRYTNAQNESYIPNNFTFQGKSGITNPSLFSLESKVLILLMKF